MATRTSGTTCSSTNNSTATAAAGQERRISRDGPAWSRNCCIREGRPVEEAAITDLLVNIVSNINTPRELSCRSSDFTAIYFLFLVAPAQPTPLPPMHAGVGSGHVETI